ncbi:MAG: hypothetical protein WD872_16405 [Pirellulaceae bacterium]
MSLFADSRYQWRETYFVLFEKQNRPLAADVRQALAEMGPRIELLHLAASKEGVLESMTVLSHADAAGMDVTFVAGDEVKEQLAEIKEEWQTRKLDPREKQRLARLMTADARYDVFHFEEVNDFPADDDDGPLDPGTLLLVLTRLAQLCHGQSLDPQSGELLA